MSIYSVYQTQSLRSRGAESKIPSSNVHNIRTWWANSRKGKWSCHCLRWAIRHNRNAKRKVKFLQHVVNIIRCSSSEMKNRTKKTFSNNRGGSGFKRSNFNANSKNAKNGKPDKTKGLESHMCNIGKSEFYVKITDFRNPNRERGRWNSGELRALWSLLTTDCGDCDWWRLNLATCTTLVWF